MRQLRTSRKAIDLTFKLIHRSMNNKYQDLSEQPASKSGCIQCLVLSSLSWGGIMMGFFRRMLFFYRLCRNIWRVSPDLPVSVGEPELLVDPSCYFRERSMEPYHRFWYYLVAWLARPFNKECACDILRLVKVIPIKGDCYGTSVREFVFKRIYFVHRRFSCVSALSQNVRGEQRV